MYHTYTQAERDGLNDEVSRLKMEASELNAEVSRLRVAAGDGVPRLQMEAAAATGVEAPAAEGISGLLEDMALVNRGYMSKSTTDSWSTPPALRASLAKKYGPFSTFDPCPLGGKDNKSVPDGLAIDWPIDTGAIFVNPPYGRLKSTKKHGLGWIQKCAEESKRGRRVVVLVPSRTDVAWFHDFVYRKSGVVYEFLCGRAKFGNSTTSAPFPSMVVIFN